MSKLNVIYLRTSTSKQEKGYQSQLSALKEHCKRNNISHFEVLGDEGVSGTKSSRPGLDKLIELIKENKVESVYVYSFSRMARSTKHLLELLDLFKNHNVNFVSVTEQVDTSTSYGKLVYTILAGVAELERSIIVERIKNGLKNAHSNGVQLGRKKKRNSLLIRELLQAGYSQTKVAKLANTSRASVWREVQGMKNRA